MKATRASQAVELKEIPNIGPAMIADFEKLGIRKPGDLKSRDPLALYQKLCSVTGTRHDPCVLDTFMAAVDFMNGAPARPWWHYTNERKKQHPSL